MSNRRSHRSGNPNRAVGLQLRATQRRLKLEAMVVVDDLGKAVASAGTPQSCGKLGSYVAVVGRRTGEFRGVLFDAERTFPVWVKRFQAGQRELYLGAVGRNAETPRSAIDQTIAGVSRILS